jgi:signal transduction histidine kinase
MRRTVRFRVTALATILCAGLFVLVALVMVLVLRNQLMDNLDEGLTQRADAFAALLADPPAESLFVDEDLLVQVVDGTGNVVQSSLNLDGAAPLSAISTGFETVSNVPGRSESFRLAIRPIETQRGRARLIVGVNFDDVADPISILIKILAGAVPGVIAVLGALVWWLTGRTLRPVEKMRSEMAEISGNNPERRVVEPNTGDEIDRLAQTMNGTLERLDNALRRQQQFVADASHELRSPLTRMRSELELRLAHPELSDPDDATRSVLGETVALQHLVEDLLHLARSDAGVELYVNEVLDLDDTVLREARRLSDNARVTVDLRHVEAVQVTGDRNHLARAIRNLLDNAERHAATRVSVSLTESSEVVRLTVSDDGIGVPHAERNAIFERFTRLDDARSRDTGGSGLGLAITREIVERHGGSIRVVDPAESGHSAGATFVVELPKPL